MKRHRSLVDKAKAINHRKLKHETTPEERELALAWMRGEVSLMQATRVLRPDKPNNGSSALYRFAVCLRDEYRAGRIVEA